jgi:hypothetical protein
MKKAPSAGLGPHSAWTGFEEGPLWQNDLRPQAQWNDNAVYHSQHRWRIDHRHVQFSNCASTLEGDIIMKLRSLAFLLLPFLAGGMGLARITSSNSPTSSMDQEKATVVQEGVMTERQKEHSKLYERYNTKDKIPALVEKEKDDLQVYRLAPLGAEVSEPLSVNEILAKITCKADVVVLGRVKDQASQLTENESFVFTDYVVVVEQVLKSGESSSVTDSSEITVTGPGGTIVLNGKRVSAVDESFLPLKTGGQYILFLRMIPATGAYMPIENGDSFEVQGNQIKTVKKVPYDRVTAEHTRLSLINQVRAAAATHCNGAKGGGK